jgi:hypothetical protein
VPSSPMVNEAAVEPVEKSSSGSSQSDIEQLRQLVVSHYRSALDINRDSMSEFVRGLSWAYRDVIELIDSKDWASIEPKPGGAS